MVFFVVCFFLLLCPACLSEGLTKALMQALSIATVDIYLSDLFVFGDISMN